jgi:hypothetical protein
LETHITSNCPEEHLKAMPTTDTVQSEAEFDLSPAPSTSEDSPLFRNIHYAQQHTNLRQQSQSTTSRSSNVISPLTAETSHALDENYVPNHYISIDSTGGMTEFAAQDVATQDTEVLGQICEAQWLASLKQRLQAHDFLSLVAPSFSIETNFYLDEQPIVFPDAGNPFQLPDEITSRHLFQCYFRTMHAMFPIIPADIETQLLNYYQMARSGTYADLTHGWYATVHLVLAIGGRFSRISDEQRLPDPFDEMICMARAYQLLGFNESAITLTPPDLNSVQVGRVQNHVLPWR